MKCHRLICRIEESQTTLKAWQKAEVEQSCSAVTTPSATPSATETLAKKRDRVPTPSKLRPQPPTPTAPPAPKVQRPSTGRARQSVTKVVVYYPSKPRGETTVCPDDTAGIIQAIAEKKWNWAAKQIIRHKDLFGPLTESIQQVIEDDCKKICNPFTGFMLSKTSAEDLKAFSFDKLQEDFQRVSPFLFSIFLTITKQSANAACAAASIAL
ncbi:uncharacterized protein LOC134466071 [Engraulis encrasicolus]|uniref:uncharacterized protein LOC134466071 n=1 Tax=Engraulis encrasicolus TaxID=184585 RepID=UPI002FD7059B